MPPPPAGQDPYTAFLAPAESPDELGRLGKYRILRVLGKGGMGVVFQAEDPILQRSVALKVMLPSVANRPDSRQRFLREARAAAKLQHPNIITIYEVGEDRDIPFMAMEFLMGEPLDARLRTAGRLSVAEALRIGRQTAEGLAAAQAQGLIHRDIKPANIWLEERPAGEGRKTKAEIGKRESTGRVKILDFGLARASRPSEHLTQLGAVMGTPAYMAPEQANAGTVDGRSDLFSLGCVLYHVLTGRKAFSGPDMYAVLLALATDTPPSPHECDPAIPRPLSDLVMRLLAKKPAHRPQTADEVADALQEMAEGVTEKVPGPAGTGQGLQTATWVYARGLGRASLTVARHSRTALLWLLPRVVDAAKVVVTPRPGEPAWLIALRYGALPAAFLALVLLAWGATTLLLSKPARQASNDPTPLSSPAPEKPGPSSKQPVVSAPVVPALATKFTNSVGMQLVLIPKGSFKMGSPQSEPDHCEDEEPCQVDIAEPFYLGAYEVTQAQYLKVMSTNPSRFAPGAAGAGRVAGLDTSRLPVESVTWKEAIEFCQKLSALPEEKRHGRLYRLPKEVEWEYACRGGSAAEEASHYGAQLSSFQANFNGNHPYQGAARGQFLARPTLIGSYAPNRFGLYDMHGNVSEWCDDWHETICLLPEAGQAPPAKEAESSTVRALRGGSWASAGRGCRSASRVRGELDDRSPYWGFRVALTVPASKAR